MLEMKLSTPADWPACKELWKLAFGDEDRYIDNFYEHFYRPERVLVLKDENGLRSMLALLPMDLRWADGGRTKAAYLYALATHPDARGQGYAMFLMRYADFYLGEQAIPFLSTVPAEESLQKYFAASVDFQPCHPIDEAELPAPAPAALPAQRVSGEAYYALREELLNGTAHAIYDVDYLDYQNKVSALFDGGLYRMDTAAGPACAVAERHGEWLDVRELLAPTGGQAEALAMLSAALSAPRCRVRCPADSCELPGAVRKVFGMGKRVPPVPVKLAESYFSLAFD